MLKPPAAADLFEDMDSMRGPATRRKLQQSGGNQARQLHRRMEPPPSAADVLHVWHATITAAHSVPTTAYVSVMQLLLLAYKTSALETLLY